MPERENSPKPDKPPFLSPLTWEIQNPDQIWEYIKDGTNAMNGSKAFISIGPSLSFTTNPQIYFDKGELEFRIGVFDEQPGHPVEFEVQNMENQLRTHLDDNLSVRNQTVFRIKPDGQEEELAKLGAIYAYNPKLSVIDAQQLENELRLALDIHRIYTTLVSHKNGIPVPEEKIIVTMGNKKDIRDLISMFENKLDTFYYLKPTPYNLDNKVLRLIQERYSQAFRDKARPVKEPLGELPFSDKPESPIDRAKKERVKKTLGAKEDVDLQTLRKAIVIENRPAVTFEQIGGQKQAVTEARKLARQLANPEIFLRWGTQPPRGILLYGEPGNGKTLIGKALANEAQAAFVLIKASDITSKWHGDSEKLTEGVFEICRELAISQGHCILFLDEVDALIPSRQGDNTGNGVHEVTKRVISLFLQAIDGLETQSGITVVATTNLPEQIDRAFLSRMTKWIEVPNPDQNGIAEILQIQFELASKRAAAAGRITPIIGNIDFTSISQQALGMSGRDLEDLVNIVLENKANQEFEIQASGASPDSLVAKEDIIQAINSSSKVREAKQRERKQRTMGFRVNPQQT